MTSTVKTSAAATNMVEVTEAVEPASNVWFREEERWELTWPIWHMLPREERRSLAHKHGYKTIGEFEEYMILQRAVGDSSATTTAPYDNSQLYGETQSTVPSSSSDHDAKVASASPNEVQREEDDEDEDQDSVDADDLDAENGTLARLLDSEDLSMEELLELGGKILMLPDDMLHRIFSWLPVDTYAKLALVSPHWKSFTRTEATYKRLCERLYLNQCKRRALHVSRFHNSYRIMLEKRPRVRAGGGVYVMKYARVRKIQRDMWTEVRICY
jgi:F-box protein 9